MVMGLMLLLPILGHRKVVVDDEPRQGEGRVLLLGVDPGLLIRRVRVMVLGFATTL